MEPPAIEALEFRLERQPLPKRILRWTVSAVGSLLTEGPVEVGDSQIAVIRRADGTRLGAIPLAANDDVNTLLARLRTEASEQPLPDFAESWGLAEP